MVKDRFSSPIYGPYWFVTSTNLVISCLKCDKFGPVVMFLVVS